MEPHIRINGIWVPAVLSPLDAEFRGKQSRIRKGRKKANNTFKGNYQNFFEMITKPYGIKYDLKRFFYEKPKRARLEIKEMGIFIQRTGPTGRKVMRYLAFAVHRAYTDSIAYR